MKDQAASLLLVQAEAKSPPVLRMAAVTVCT